MVDASHMYLVDNHSHILLSRTMDMLASAKTKNISEFSITEHVSQFKNIRESITFGSMHDSGRIFESLNEYNDEFTRGRLGHPELKINQGLEVDFSPRFEKQVGDFVNRQEWDILLCSVHEFEDGKDIEKSVRGTADLGSAHERWYEYLQLQRMALESDFIPFKVLSHPVRMSRATKAAPSDLDDLLLGLARIARRRNKALELNGRDIDYAPELVRRLAAACSIAGCRVSLGSDAHHPSDVFRNMEIALALVTEFNLELG